MSSRNILALEFSTDHRSVAVVRDGMVLGESIQESPADLAKEMRHVVRDQLAAGRSGEEVKAYFVSKYGEWILLEPKPRGVNLTVYVAPFLLLLGGAWLIVRSVRKWTSPRAGSVPDSPAP